MSDPTHENRDDSNYLRSGSGGGSGRPWFVFRRELSLGTLVSILIWLVIGVMAWTRIGDRLDYLESAQHDEREEQIEITKTLAGIQQSSASTGAVLAVVQERQRQDEDELYGPNKGK